MSRSAPRRTPAEQSAGVLRDRIKELENEVSTLKSRLGDLRKAKSNTVVKREREVIHVGQPNMGRPPGIEPSKFKEVESKLSVADAKVQSLNKEIEKLNDELKKLQTNKTAHEKSHDSWKAKHDELENSINNLQMNHEIELGKLKNIICDKSAQIDDFTAEIERLRERLELKATQEEHKGIENISREEHILKLTNDNALLREKIEALYMDLSVKEAEWTVREEKLQLEMKRHWGERYATWMEATEKKIQELHETNEMLKSCLQKGDRRKKENIRGFTEDDQNDANGHGSSS